MKQKYYDLFFLSIAIFVLLGLFSCEGGSRNNSVSDRPETPSVKDETAIIGDSSDLVGGVGNNLVQRAEKINGHTRSIEASLPPPDKSIVTKDVEGIRTETKGLVEDSNTLASVKKQLDMAEEMLIKQQSKINDFVSYTKDSEKQRVDLVNKIRDLESSNAKIIKTMLSWVTVCCVIGIGASLVIGFFFKTPAAFMVAAGCVATMGIAVAVTLYLQQIAWIALALLGVGFLSAVVYVFVQVKNRDTAVKELVHTGEIAKSYLPTTVREKIFGNSVEPGVAHQIQSNSTIKLVRNVRSLDKNKRGYDLAPQLPKFWKPTSVDLLEQSFVQDPYNTVLDPYKAPEQPFNGSVVQDSTKTILG